MVYNSFINFPWNSWIYLLNHFPAQEIISHWVCEYYFHSFDGNHCKYLGYALFSIISHLSPGWRQPLLLLRPYSLFILYFHLRPKDSDCSVLCSNASFPLPWDCGPDHWQTPVRPPASASSPTAYPSSPYTQRRSLLLLLVRPAPSHPPWFMPPLLLCPGQLLPVLYFYS